MILRMKFGKRTQEIARKFEAMAHKMETSEPTEQDATHQIVALVGWATAAVGAVALGLFVGRELRYRYKFKRRTPYDFYSHSGDKMQDVEYSVGV